MFHHCNDPIWLGHSEHLELPRCCIVTCGICSLGIANELKILNQAASTRCGAGNKEKLSANTRS